MISYDTEYVPSFQVRPKITVLGIGGAGGNAINAIMKQNVSNVMCAALNTDMQALNNVICEKKIQLGSVTSQGLGTGANPEIGRVAAEEDMQKIIELVHDSDIVFLIAGLGGGTGSGALPVIARMLQENEILSVALVTKPFVFEGSRRMNVANHALSKIEEYVDTAIVIPNQKLFEQQESQQIPLMDAFEKINMVIVDCIRAISDTVFNPGHINVDFADIKTTISRMGRAVIGMGIASGENRAQEVIEKTLNSPLLEFTTLKGARSLLLNIHGDHSLTLQEMNSIASHIYEQAHPDAHIIVGSSISESMGDYLQLTVIATGFEDFNVKNKNHIRGNTQSFYQQKNNYNAHAPFNNYNNTMNNQNIYNNQNQSNILNQNHQFLNNQQSGSGINNRDIQDLNIEVPTFFRKNNQNQDQHNN